MEGGPSKPASFKQIRARDKNCSRSSGGRLRSRPTGVSGSCEVEYQVMGGVFGGSRNGLNANLSNKLHRGRRSRSAKPSRLP